MSMLRAAAPGSSAGESPVRPRDEDQRRILLEGVSAFLWSSDAEGRLCVVNAHICEFTGATEAELLAGGWERIVHPDDLPALHAGWQRARADCVIHEFECRLRRADGAFRWHLGRSRPLRSGAGAIVQWVGSAMDIDEKRRASSETFRSAAAVDVDEGVASRPAADSRPRQVLGFGRDLSGHRQTAEELAESQRLFRHILDATPDVLYLYDLTTGRSLYINREITSILGYTPRQFEALGGEIVPSLFHPDDLPHVLAELERYHSLKDGEALDYEYRMRHADGSWRWIRSHAVVFSRGPDGRAAQVVGLAQDITQRKWAEDALRESERRFRRLVEANLFGVTMCSFDGRIFYANDYLLGMLGYSREKMDESLCYDLLTPPEWLPLDAMAATELRETGVARPYEKECIRRDGTRVPILIGSVLQDEPWETCDTIISFYLDLTEQKSAERAMRDADRRKDEFLAMLSHELRNPLAPIRSGLAVIAESRSGPPSQRSHSVEDTALAMVDRQVTNLVRLVDDLLDVSRITRGKAHLRKGLVDLRGVMEQAVETVQPLVNTRRQELRVRLPERPLLVEGDLTRLSQVIGNLLHNAAKYTDDGGTIRLTAEPQGTEAVVRVEDTGIGIAADMMPHIFELFTQADRSLDRSRGGLGIGLTVVRSLVEMHGGRVSAESPGLGRGSVFTVRLPLAEQQTSNEGPGVEPASGPAERRCRVLVVDDNEDSAATTAILIGHWGHEVKTAHDGPTGIALARAFRPEVVLLDIGLPGMNGYQVAQTIRAIPELAAVRLIAMTGYGKADDRRRSLASGFDWHLVKPVSAQELKALVQPGT